MMVQSSGDLTDLVEASEEQLQAMREEAALVDTNTLMRYIRIFSDLSGQVRYSTQKRVLVEVALIKLCQPAMERNLDSVLNRLAVLEKKIAQGIVAVPQMYASAQGGGPDRSEGGADVWKPQQKAVSEDIKMIIERWKQVLEDLTPSMALMLKGARISEGPEHQLVIGLTDEMRYGYFEEENHRQTLEQVLAERVGKEIRIVLVRLQQEAAAGDFIDPVQAFQGIDIIYED